MTGSLKIAGCVAHNTAMALCADAEQAIAFYHIHVNCQTRDSLITCAGSRAAAAWSLLEAHLRLAQTKGEESDLREWHCARGLLQNLRMVFFKCNNQLSPASAGPSASAKQPAAAALAAASRDTHASHQLPALTRQLPTEAGTAAWQARHDDSRRLPDPDAEGWALASVLMQEPIQKALKRLGRTEPEIKTVLSGLAASGTAAFDMLDDEAMALIAAEQFPPLTCKRPNPVLHACCPIHGSHAAATDTELIICNPDANTASRMQGVHLDQHMLQTELCRMYPSATAYVETDCDEDGRPAEPCIQQILLKHMDVSSLKQFVLAGIIDILARALIDDAGRQMPGQPVGRDWEMTAFRHPPQPAGIPGTHCPRLPPGLCPGLQGPGP